jgi:hypothetical protein
MMTIIVMVAAATVAPPCPAPIGEPVTITSTPLSVETLGGGYHTDTGWPAPGEAHIGQLRYDWGLMLRSDDTRFANFDLSPGPVHSRSSGCWFRWDSTYGKTSVGRGVTGISNGRIGTSGYRDGYVPPRPDTTPTIPGYRFVAANAIHREDFTWVGLWNAQGSAERSRIVAFNAERHQVLATLPIRFGAIAQLPDLHSQAYHLTLIGEGKPGRPVPWMRLIWLGGPPGSPYAGAKNGQ